jgi:thiamine-phosphate pyrophosphorylase
VKKIGRLCVITDISIQTKYSHLDIARMAIKGGADMIQFRDKKMSTTELIETAIEIKKLCRKTNTTFIINDRVDVAMIVDADGVHLGKEDIPVNEARKLLGRDKIIGITNREVHDRPAAHVGYADYIGFGHIFPTKSKIKTTRPVGLDNLKKMVSLNKIPMIAIGGINIHNAPAVMATGVHGIAVIAGVIKTDDPVKSVQALKKIIYGKKY